MATKLALGVLATTLMATAAMPAFAVKPDRDQHGDREKQKQAQDVDLAGKGKGNKSKTVTKTFSSDDAIEIPAGSSVEVDGPANPYPSTIAAAGFKKARIADINLTLRGFSHTDPRDVDVLLVAPGGRNALVMGEVGSPLGIPSTVSNITLSLDDEAATALPAEELLTSGAFRPFANVDPTILGFPAPAPRPGGDAALSTFDGINPNGQWQLFILDEFPDDVGSLAGGWTLEITAKAKSKGKKRH